MWKKDKGVKQHWALTKVLYCWEEKSMLFDFMNLFWGQFEFESFKE